MIHELRSATWLLSRKSPFSSAPGLNVLTGETGAGKSMLVDAVSLLLGGRGDSGMVRPGAPRAIIEGAFALEDLALRRRLEAQGLDAEEGRLVIRREIGSDGRSKAWVKWQPDHHCCTGPDRRGAGGPARTIRDPIVASCRGPARYPG